MRSFRFGGCAFLWAVTLLTSAGCSDTTGPKAEDKLGPFSAWSSP
jgi:hypothetical protein